MELKLLSQLCEEPLTSFKDFLKIFFKNPGERMVKANQKF
jgi:hypothetical protein